MVGAVAVSFLLVLMVVYVPFLAPFFDTVPLTAGDWLLMLPFFFASPIAMELLKVYFRSRKASARERARSTAAPAAFADRSAAGCRAGPATTHWRKHHAEDPDPRRTAPATTSSPCRTSSSGS